MGRNEYDDAKQRAIDSWVPSSQKGGRGGKAKPTYDKTSIFGSSKHAEGKAASRESKKDQKRWR